MRHRLHAICPYFAMFPERFVQKHLVWSEDGGVVFDPFCGRGTTILESLLFGRNAIGSDINPVAVCVSKAKASRPNEYSVYNRLAEIEGKSTDLDIDEFGEFFHWCFEKETFGELLKLRESLDWYNSDVDAFIAATTLGLLHGESHKTMNCLSNRMPRTISTKPDYSLRWWKRRALKPPRRPVFDVLRRAVSYRLEDEVGELAGVVRHCDVREASDEFAEYRGSVDLVITSPPYLDTTSFAEDQWLRLWFLGGPDRPDKESYRDDRYRDPVQYWNFLAQAWRGIEPLLSEGCDMVVRIGGKKFSYGAVEEGLLTSFERGFTRQFELVGATSSSSERSQASSFRPGSAGKYTEHDFHIRLDGR